MSSFMEYYKDIMYNKKDPRTSEWFLMSSPGPVLVIIATYIYVSTNIGPKFMRDKKPLELRNVMILYNLIQVLLSMYLFYEGLASGWLYDYSLTCQPIDYSNNPKALRMARIVHFYFMCKLIELLDTVFFILRKKNRQISGLHVFHHSLMPFCAWVGCRWMPNGHGTLLGVINAFVHVIMYTYYMLSSIGPHMNKYLWWKKHLTTLQLIQFGIVFVHSTQVMFNGCNYPKFIAFLLALNSVIFIYLFGSFYIRTYMQTKKTISPKSTETSNGNIKSNKSD